MASCIYCGSEANSREHWLPRSLGTFGSLQVLHDKVCEPCNGVLGREVDEAFIRTGPEAILRLGLGIEGQRGPGANPFYHRAATDQPVRATNVSADDEPELLWETFRGENGEPQAQLRQQLVVIDGQGIRHLIPFNTAWTAEILRAALSHRRIENGTLREVYLDEEHVQHVRPVLREIFPGFRAELFGRSGAGQTVRRLGFENNLGPDYFRGLSKIAFHGALRLVPELDAHAWEFDSLRRFIRYAELPASRPIWRTQGSLIAELGNGVMLRDWVHVIVIEAGEHQIFVMLQFFVGPGAIPPAWVVRLGRRPAGVLPDLAIAYLARYLERPSSEGLTGEFMRLDMVPASL